MRILKFEVPLTRHAGEQTLEFSLMVPGKVNHILSAVVKSNDVGHIYIETEPSPFGPNWESEVCFFLVSTGTEFERPLLYDRFDFVATLVYLGGQGVYHLYRTF